MENFYIISFAVAFVVSLSATLFFRFVAMKLNIYDHPITAVKTHKISTPYLGGLAIWSAWIISLITIRLFTNFPTGTLTNIRALLIGSLLFLLLGLFDDIKKGGLGFKIKFLIQIAASLVVTVGFDIRISFIDNYFISIALSILWIIGLSNAFNLIDIMDGLSCGIATIASFFFFFIALPSEMLYVNFSAIALVGACLGFLPYNLSKKRKIFMGDTGSLSIGFILATIALGTSYTKLNLIGVFAPLLILAVPLFETIFVSLVRIENGKSPFLGSKDHFPLRLEKIGFSRKQILIIVYITCVILGTFAYLFVNSSSVLSIFILIFISLVFIFMSYMLAKVKMD
ncbi:MAG: MraY family glycosyltransferase [Endomicrobiaceae bacterium]|nr:MraY family glycosyltransferase [Endomicrobiaceae bacterium]